MAYGIFSYFGYELALRRRIELIAAAGFTHTSLWWGPPDEAYLAGRIEEAPDWVRSAGLTLENMHAPFEECNDVWSRWQRRREGFLRRHVEWLGACRRHGIGCMVMHVTHSVPSPDPTPAGLAVLRTLAQHAAEAGVTLAIENTRRDDVVDFVLSGLADFPGVGLCYDSSHDWLWGRPRTGLLSRWGSRLVQTHLSDCGRDDRHLLPGDGEVDWPTIAAAFPKTYAGRLMLEVLPTQTSHASPEAFLTEARKRLEELRHRYLIRDT